MLDFKIRFKLQTSTIDDATPDMLVSAFVNALPQGNLKTETTLRRPRTMGALYEKIEQFRELEEREEGRPVPTAMVVETPRYIPTDNLRKSKASFEPSLYNKRFRFDRKFTPLAVSASFSLHFLIDAKILELPKQWGGPSRGQKPGNLQAYCEFHRYYDHSTEVCWALKHQFENLREDGKLPIELDTPGTEQASTARLPQPRPAREERMLFGDVHVISGPFLVDTRGKKRMLEDGPAVRVVNPNRQVNSTEKDFHGSRSIEFTQMDVGRVEPGHNNALVISIEINGWRVHRVLVDPDSSTQILFLKTYEKFVMNKEVKKAAYEIVGFNGSKAKSVGELTLPVWAEGVELEVTFVIIDSKSLYNAILGREWIHALEAIPSTFHQIIKFPSKWGIGEIRGEPVTAK